ncbi:MAG: phosphate ABC transporter permease PstA [Gemmobacter sp.]|nr:phosphate ABC transporter permease PstA [Gemmobacter sp.]
MDSALRDSNISPEQLTVAQAMADAGLIEVKFNLSFLTAPDASELRPEAAGLGVAILGSAYMMLIVLVLSLPIGVASSIYLEELAPKNKWTDLIEVNIANLAAVPSIVYGILALALFINFAGLPQSAPIVGGLVLTLMTLPTIIIATRAALKAVPPSIRDAALGVGASKMQAIFHHVLPLAMPGILTGTILGLARALGESAPLLLIGMVAFVKDYPAAPPEGLMQPATALPVQVYQWTQRSDPAFVERASGAIIVLLVFLLIMNAVAIMLRRRFERRW